MNTPVSGDNFNQGPNNLGHMVNINITDELKNSFRDYSMTVIIGRALPDIRDGLKPVHRRILYAMYKEGLLSNKKFSKCAGVVGEVLKKYHPHGDAPVYEALVRMAQPWNMRELLIEGQGNFGSIDGDPPAAYRYTEARMSKIAEMMLIDIDQETVDFRPNFDGTTDEPLVLPSRVPNLLINGSEGIAVAMATKCPPHNLGEIIDGLLALIAEQYDNGPIVSFEMLDSLIPGPDFPTGGIICGRASCAQALRTGRGSVIIRGKCAIEKSDDGHKERIIVSEIPYQVNKARLLERMAELVRDKKLEGISDLRDESDRDGMRIVIEVKRDAMAEVVLNALFQLTPLQSSYAINMVSIVNGQPMTLNMRQHLEHFLSFRREIVTKRTRFQLKEAENRFHLLVGLIIALNDIDRVIAIIRTADDTEHAKQRLKDLEFNKALDIFKESDNAYVQSFQQQGFFKLDDHQCSAILEMRLAKLVGLEQIKLIAEAKALLAEIIRLQAILSDINILMTVIKKELIAIKEEFKSPRQSIFAEEAESLSKEDLIAEEEVLVTISHLGYIKRASLSNYRSQKRGGKGKTAMSAKNEDFVQDAFVASTHAYLLAFTNLGKVYWVKVHELPDGSAQSRGRPIINLIKLEANEQVCAILPVRHFPLTEDLAYVVSCTQKGKVKKTDLLAYSNPRSNGLIACGIEEGDELIAVKITDGKSHLLLSTKQGMAIRFLESEVRSLGRQAIGVRGIKLKKDDAVVSMEVLHDNATILTVTENGYGKRTNADEYRLQSRGGMGIITIKVDERNGAVVSAMRICDDDDIMIVTNLGKLIRMKALSISTYGRNTKGLRLISIDKAEGEKVSSLVYIKEENEEE